MSVRYRWSRISPVVPSYANQVGGPVPLNLYLASQNCNSLNVSTSCEKQLKKVTLILELCTSIIFLSDLRLGNSETVQELEKTFKCNKICSYSFFHNLSKNKRGVGILINNKLNFDVVADFRA
jgi:hypothetical protein